MLIGFELTRATNLFQLIQINIKWPGPISSQPIAVDSHILFIEVPYTGANIREKGNFPLENRS
jgi:hypothetical protein